MGEKMLSFSEKQKLLSDIGEEIGTGLPSPEFENGVDLVMDIIDEKFTKKPTKKEVIEFLEKRGFSPDSLKIFLRKFNDEDEFEIKEEYHLQERKRIFIVEKEGKEVFSVEKE